MANSFSLDDIRTAADAKYASTDITLDDGTLVVLVNPLRLPKEKRAALTAIQERIDGDKGEEQDALLAEALTVICETTAQSTALLEELNGDLALLATVFESYAKGTQAGEA